MKSFKTKLLLARWLLLFGLLVAPAIKVHAALYQWAVVNGEEDRRAYLWIPEDCKRIRGLILVMKNLTEPGIPDNPVVREACRQERIGIVYVGDGWPRSAFGSDWGWPKGLSVEDEKEYARLKGLIKASGTPAEELQAAKDKVLAWDKELTAKAGVVLNDLLKRLADESGYEEVARAPLFTISHSMGGLLCWHLPYWLPERMWGSMPIKTGVRTQPELLPDSNMHGVPVLYMDWAGILPPEGPPAVNKWPFAPRKDPQNLVGRVFDWGGTHFDMTDDMARIAAMFIRKASKYRLSDEIPASGYPKLKDLKAEQGWLASTLDEREQYAMAPASQYTGPKDKALWYFDQEMAKTALGHNLADSRKKPQYVTVVSNGRELKPFTFAFDAILIPQDTAVDDGLTFKLEAKLLDTVPSKDPAQAVPTGHAVGVQPMIKLTGGNSLVQLDKNTFRYRKYNNMGHGWLVAHAPGDQNYARTNYQATMWGPDNRKGTPQTITFPEIPNIKYGTREVTLTATSNVPGQVVEYYVLAGPAEITGRDPKYTGNILRMRPMPPSSKFPVKVTVVAYQMGRSLPPLVQTAKEVTREFLITRP